MTLPKEAAAELVKHQEASSAWTELTGAHYDFPTGSIAKKRQKGDVLINLAPTDRIEIREGLAKSNIDKQTAAQTQERPAEPPEGKPAYSSALCAQHRPPQEHRCTGNRHRQPARSRRFPWWNA